MAAKPQAIAAIKKEIAIAGPAPRAPVANEEGN